MNSMTTALKTSGIKLPSLKYRIWHWLKDHSEKTADDIQKALSLSYPPSAELRDMEARGMVAVYSDVSRKSGLKGIEYRVKRFSVTNRSEYIVGEKPEASKPVKKHIPVAKERKFNQTMQQLQTLAAEVPKPKAKADLTEAEKFAAFLEFKALMKEMK